MAQEQFSSEPKSKERYYPSYQSLVKLSDLFHVSIDYLMGRSERGSTAGPTETQDELVLALFHLLDERKREKALAYIQGLSEQ